MTKNFLSQENGLNTDTKTFVRSFTKTADFSQYSFNATSKNKFLMPK